MAAGVEELEAFVADALLRGESRADIEKVLLAAGWTAEQVNGALGAYADVPFSIPVPKPRPSLSAREAFLYLTLFGTVFAFGAYLTLLGRIGAERARGTYAFRSLLDAGAVLAFGTDWNVAPLDPLQGIAAAVTRRTLDGKHPSGWVPEQKITLEEAVRAYTVGSAHAEFAEREKGQLAPDMLADFVLLSQDIFSVAPAEIGKTRAVLTVVDGRVVYQSE